jgi:hypothetical protein
LNTAVRVWTVGTYFFVLGDVTKGVVTHLLCAGYSPTLQLMGLRGLLAAVSLLPQVLRVFRNIARYRRVLK